MGEYSEALLNDAGPPPPKPAAGGEYSAALLGIDPGAPARQQSISDPARSASFSDIAVASLANDPQARVRYFAKQRGIPESRYSVENGQISYQGDDGKWYLEIPTGDYGPAGVGKQIASGVGTALSTVPPAAVGMASAPLLLAGPAGMASSMGLTAAAGAAAQSLREFLANKFVGDQEISPARIAVEGATQALGQGIGGGLTSLAQRHAVKGIQSLDRPKMAELQAKADKADIPLTPAETTGLPSLAAQQKALGNLPVSSDTMGKFYEERARRASDAVGRLLDDISPQDSPELAGRLGRKAAQDAAATAKAVRAAKAAPIYEEAFARNQSVVSPELDRILDTPSGRIALRGAVRKMRDDRGLVGAPDKELTEAMREAAEVGKMTKVAIGVAKGLKLRTWDYVKRSLWATAENLEKKDPDHARIVKKLYAQAVDELDKLDTTGLYSKARKVWSDDVPVVDALESGLTGAVAGLKDENLQRAAARLFNPATAGPQAMAAAKNAISRADPDAWQALKRAWLQQNWETAGREFATTGAANQGTKFRALVLGDARRQQMMAAALTPKEYTALTDLADVLQAAGSVKRVMSDTAWNQEMMKVGRQQATPALAKVARALRPQDWGKMIEDWATERSLGNNAERMAKIITQRGAAERLRELRQLSPSSARFRAGLGLFLVDYGRYALGGGGPDIGPQPQPEPPSQ